MEEGHASARRVPGSVREGSSGERGKADPDPWLVVASIQARGRRFPRENACLVDDDVKGWNRHHVCEP